MPRRADTWLLFTLGLAGCGLSDTLCSTVTVGTETLEPVRACVTERGPPRMVPFWIFNETMRSTIDEVSSRQLAKVPWGSEHDVEVGFRRWKSTLAIGGTRVEFRRVIASRPRPSECFVIHMEPTCFGRDGRSFIDGQAFTCATPDVCAKLDAQLAPGAARHFLIRLRLPERPGAPLRLEDADWHGESQWGGFPCPTGDGGVLAPPG